MILMNPSVMTPKEIDTELARIWAEMNQAKTRIASTERRLRQERQALLPRPRNIEQLENNLEALERLSEALQDEADPFEAEFSRRGGWNRYFLVNNANGHVHRGMNCNTCFITTQYRWLVDLADCDEAAMIEEWGETACTVCFSSAPSHPAFYRPSKESQAEKAARQAEKAAREAKKAEKNLTAEEQFRGPWGMVTTVAGAKQAIRDAIEMANYGGPGVAHCDSPKYQEAAQKATEVLLARGVTQAEIDKIVTNAKKKNGVK